MFHINADIADAVPRYPGRHEDASSSRKLGLELLVETARLWRSLGQHDAMGRFRIEGVTGPDEYSAIKDNNIYTNLMAQRNLACAADLAVKLPDQAEALGVTMEEAAAWRDAATAISIPFDERLGVHPQHEGFTDYARWDFKNTPEDHYPLLLHYPYFQLYRKQVVKQADLVLAMYMRPDAFTAEQKARNFAYYEPLTVRDSSLSACTQSVMAAEVGQLDLAHDYLAEAALMDLRDVEHNTSDGVHMASLAGAWTALAAGSRDAAGCTPPSARTCPAAWSSRGSGCATGPEAARHDPSSRAKTSCSTVIRWRGGSRQGVELEEGRGTGDRSGTAVAAPRSRGRAPYSRAGN